MANDKNLISEVLSASPNRRSLIKKLAMATAAVGAGSTVGAVKAYADPSAPTAADVVQFALNLEYVESEFYSIATSGKTIDQFGIAITGMGASGPTTTMYKRPVNFSNNTVFTSGVANDIALDERNHVVLLRTALMDTGYTPIAKPAIDLDALASAGASLLNQATFLTLSRIFEDIGVTAYAGGSTLLAGSPYLQTAARILAVEGEHVANIRLQIAKFGIPSPTLDGADVPPPPTGMNFFSTNTKNGLVAIRTPGEVLYLAYGNKAGVTKGGFFPNGVNGNLHTSSGPATATNLN